MFNNAQLGLALRSRRSAPAQEGNLLQNTRKRARREVVKPDLLKVFENPATDQASRHTSHAFGRDHERENATSGQPGQRPEEHRDPQVGNASESDAHSRRQPLRRGLIRLRNELVSDERGIPHRHVEELRSISGPFESARYDHRSSNARILNLTPALLCLDLKWLDRREVVDLATGTPGQAADERSVPGAGLEHPQRTVEPRKRMHAFEAKVDERVGRVEAASQPLWGFLCSGFHDPEPTGSSGGKPPQVAFVTSLLQSRNDLSHRVAHSLTTRARPEFSSGRLAQPLWVRRVRADRRRRSQGGPCRGYSRVSAAESRITHLSELLFFG